MVRSLIGRIYPNLKSRERAVGPFVHTLAIVDDPFVWFCGLCTVVFPSLSTVCCEDI